MSGMTIPSRNCSLHRCVLAATACLCNVDCYRDAVVGNQTQAGTCLCNVLPAHGDVDVVWKRAMQCSTIPAGLFCLISEKQSQQIQIPSI